MDAFQLMLLIFGPMGLGWFLGERSQRESVKAEISRHTVPSHRKLRDLPHDELLGILDFAITGRKPTGW